MVTRACCTLWAGIDAGRANKKHTLNLFCRHPVFDPEIPAGF